MAQNSESYYSVIDDVFLESAFSCAVMPRGEDKQGEPTKPVVPTEPQLKILKYLGCVGVTVAQADIVSAREIGKGKRTVAKALKGLKAMSYVSAPPGSRYHVGITQQGKDYLKSIEDSTC